MKKTYLNKSRKTLRNSIIKISSVNFKVTLKNIDYYERHSWEDINERKQFYKNSTERHYRNYQKSLISKKIIFLLIDLKLASYLKQYKIILNFFTRN